MNKLARMNTALGSDLWIAVFGTINVSELFTVLDLPMTVPAERLRRAIKEAVLEAIFQGLDLGDLYDCDDVVEALMEAYDEMSVSGDA